ncbi:MAG: rhomboid family intramembrane serine protease [Porticoccaceae bacterium]|nr:rhomboid family intramembrane serine protease [Porticoccaceae bacterium]MDG1308780.1 rhomboid family intramembrane serine protease [Porticoccaceae bacterium]
MSQQLNWLLAARQNPVVSLLIMASVFGCAVTSFFPQLERALFFNSLDSGQYWRLITPIFLHFGLVHLVFNSLWLSMLGSRIEHLNGSSHFILLVLVTGAVSNMAQYLWSGSIYFGGMSGVVYALLGYIWIKHKLVPNPVLQLPPGIVGFMLGWLAVCMTGIVDVVLGVGVANAAHLGGLVIGMLLGLIFGVLGKLLKR